MSSRRSTPLIREESWCSWGCSELVNKSMCDFTSKCSAIAAKQCDLVAESNTAMENTLKIPQGSNRSICPDRWIFSPFPALKQQLLFNKAEIKE
ncbi:hypothetical protein OIU74_001833, partial [Salix koriyanagi]